MKKIIIFLIIVFSLALTPSLYEKILYNKDGYAICKRFYDEVVKLQIIGIDAKLYPDLKLLVETEGEKGKKYNEFWGEISDNYTIVCWSVASENTLFGVDYNFQVLDSEIKTEKVIKFQKKLNKSIGDKTQYKILSKGRKVFTYRKTVNKKEIIQVNKIIEIGKKYLDKQLIY